MYLEQFKLWHFQHIIWEMTRFRLCILLINVGNTLQEIHVISKLKLKSKRLALETKNTLKLKNGSLGFIETLYKQ